LSATAPAIHDQPDWPFSFALSTAPLAEDNSLWLAVATAGVLALLSLAAACYGFRVRRRVTGWIGIAGLVVGIIAGVRLFVVPAYPTSFAHSTAAYAAPAIAAGARLYAGNCVACHGASGLGDGPAAAALDPKPANLTEPHLFHHGEGTLFWWIGHGITGSAMPGFAGTIDAAGRWNLIQFLRAQAEAEQAASLSPAVEPFSGVVAPDFAFQIGGGRQQTLKSLRGKAIVHLVLYTLPGSLDRLRQIAAASAELARSGVRTIALPIGEAPPPDLPTAAGMLAAPDADTVATYMLYRRLPNNPSPAPPTHIEFLIDRAGYLRARWTPGAGAAGGWSDLSRLKEEIERLASEPPRPPAPEGHVHG
jgi:putative copper resistance protein D